MVFASILFGGLAVPELKSSGKTPTRMENVMAMAHMLKDHPDHKELGSRAVTMFLDHGELEDVMLQEVLMMSSTVLSPSSAAQADAEVTESDEDKQAGGKHVEEASSSAHVHEGDMAFTSASHLENFLSGANTTVGATGSLSAGQPWAHKNLNYCLDPSATQAVKKAVMLSVAQFRKAVPGLTMTDVGFQSSTGGGPDGSAGLCKTSPAVFVTSKHKGCWSYVGEIKSWKSQVLNLESPGCDSLGTTMHEFLHAFGQAHEQSRPDRDTYVKVDFANVPKNVANNFQKSPNGDTNRPYDMLSLMHYGSTAFAPAGKKSIEPLAAAYALYTKDPSQYHKYKLGNRVGMTQLDADQLAEMYGVKAQTLADLGPCTDRKKPDGSAWTDVHGQTCNTYRTYFPKSCHQYVSGSFCCSGGATNANCGGGIQLQSWKPPGPQPNPLPPPPAPPPSLPPKAPPNPPPSPPPTAVDPPATCQEVVLRITGGQYAEEIGVKLDGKPLVKTGAVTDHQVINNKLGCLAIDSTHSVQLSDSYGDGWNGGFLEEVINENVVLTLGKDFTAGTSKSYSFTVPKPIKKTDLKDIRTSYVCNSWMGVGYCNPSSPFYHSVKRDCQRTCSGVPTDAYSNCPTLGKTGLCGASFTSGKTVKEMCPDSCKGAKQVSGKGSADNSLLPQDDIEPESQEPTEVPATLFSRRYPKQKAGHVAAQGLKASRDVDGAAHQQQQQDVGLPFKIYRLAK